MFQKYQIGIVVIGVLLSKLSCCLAHSPWNDENSNNDSATWEGPWFPHDPNANASSTAVTTTVAPIVTTTVPTVQTPTTLTCDDYVRLGIPFPKGSNDLCCDNTRRNLTIDFDPYDPVQATIYLCLDAHRELYKPNISINPIMTEYVIPPKYVAPHRCMTHSIVYKERIPTFGPHRPFWAVYGEFKYVPPQRWLHNLEHGAITMLYHPCANEDQTDKLKLIIKRCLYRHVITASDLTTPERPFALVAWGKSLEFSVVDESVVIGFIRMYALQGPEALSRNGQYTHLMVDRARIVTTNDDSLLCPNM